MKKTGRLLHLFIAILLFTSTQAMAQSVEVSTQLSNNKLFPGEQVRLTLTISGTQQANINRPDLPEIEGLRWLVNSTGSSTNYSLVNGQPSVTYSYTYTLVAEEPGSYRIPSITVTVNDKEFKTRAIPFEIINRDELADSDPNKFPEIFVEIELDDDTPVPGQQVIASVMLYFKDGIEVASYQPTPGWKAEGFWKENLDDNKRPTATSVIKGGIRFRKARLMQYALFPTKSGELELSPFEITVTVRTPRNRSMDFFNFGNNQKRMSIESEPKIITVSELPELNDAIYLGAVGNFNIEREMSITDALIGESIEVETTIQGFGNITLIPKPEFTYPSGLEQYEPQESSQINRKGNQISGTKKFSDILIARTAGDFVIPAVNVAFYDPKENIYVRRTLPELRLKATRDPNALVNSVEDLQLEITAVTGLTNWVSTSDYRLAAYPLTWVLLVLPLIIMGVGYVVSTRKHKMETDHGFARSQKAFKQATTVLEEIDPTGDVKAGYASIHKSITRYIADKLGLGEGSLSDQAYITKLEEASISEATVKEVKQLLTKCSTISYVPDASSESLTQDIELAENLIKELKKEL